MVLSLHDIPKSKPLNLLWKTTVLNTCWIFFSGSEGQNLNSKYRKSPGQWILNDMWHFPSLWFIWFHSCNLFTYSFTQQDLLGSRVQELCAVGCRYPEGIMVFPDLHQLMAYCRNRHANNYNITSCLTTEQVLGIRGAETEAWTFGGGNSGESEGVSLAFQEKNDPWRTNRCWAWEEG